MVKYFKGMKSMEEYEIFRSMNILLRLKSIKKYEQVWYSMKSMAGMKGQV